MRKSRKPSWANDCMQRTRRLSFVCMLNVHWRRVADAGRWTGMRMLVILLGFALVGCASSPRSAKGVSYADGVDKQEASALVDEYLQQHLSASLGHTGPYDGGVAWVFRITGDVVPVELPDIPPVFIDKTTGAVTWDAKPPLKK